MISNERELTSLESFERKVLLDNGEQIDYHLSLPAYSLARAYIKAVGPILDFSSVVQPESFIYKSLFQSSRAAEAQVQILAKMRKNMELLIKDEADGKRISSVIAGEMFKK